MLAPCDSIVFDCKKIFSKADPCKNFQACLTTSFHFFKASFKSIPLHTSHIYTSSLYMRIF